MSHPIRKFQIGVVQVELVVESSGPLLHPAEIFPDSDPHTIARQGDWLSSRLYDPASDRLVICMQSFLLRSAGKIILVDTCVGDCKQRVRPEFDEARWNWLDRLAQAGVAPEQVDIVLSTHLHVDHIGWNTHWADGRWVPTFPNARYLFVDKEYEYWSSEAGRSALQRTGDYVEDSVRPIFEAGLAEIVGVGHQIDGSLRLLHAPGHTPGHVCIEISSEGQNAIITGDLLHHPLQCRFPGWSTRFCFDANQSRKTRLAFMSEHAGRGTLLFPAHFPDPTAGYLRAVDDPDEPHYRYEFVQD
ncbi:MBL fold metallo-hydrolase [Pusillimonas noertemannii]|uniref:MBL fold metallo-hydrolase n=1 Tax=Pusillimonas noertemannii TaxID=305977 RepID=UPI001FCB66A1|nr:MBL fold metallo-hydrolase [Pusillimonas noertemannii]